MSRIGKHPVPVPAGVTVEIGRGALSVNGKLGTLQTTLWDDLEITHEDRHIVIKPRNDTIKARQMWGTARSLIRNLVQGVSEGFTRQLEITGVGYRAQVQGHDLVLQLGYSHEVRYAVPEGISVTCPDQTHITIKGADRQRVGQVAAVIRSYRPPEPYKGKGIKYSDEVILRKEGKKK